MPGEPAFRAEYVSDEVGAESVREDEDEVFRSADGGAHLPAVRRALEIFDTSERGDGANEVNEVRVGGVRADECARLESR